MNIVSALILNFWRKSGRKPFKKGEGNVFKNSLRRVAEEAWHLPLGVRPDLRRYDPHVRDHFEVGFGGHFTDRWFLLVHAHLAVLPGAEPLFGVEDW